MGNKYLDRIYGKKHLGINIQNDWQDFMQSLGANKQRNTIKIMVYVGVLNVAYYRIFTPLMELVKNRRYDIRMSTVLSSQDDIDWADIIWFERCTDKNIIREASRAKKLGKKIIFDTDDLMHGLPMHHPMKRNIENSRYLPNMDELCLICDLITVSTPYLAELYEKKYGVPVAVLPNCIRIEDYECSLKYKSNQGISIGWSGSATHFEDLQLVTPALVKLFSKYENIFLTTLNYCGVEITPYRDAFEGIPDQRRIGINGTHPHLVYGYMNMMDIGIAPLLDNDFNRAKSNVKFMEYSLCGTPTVASDLDPYRNEGKHIDLVNDYNGWVDRIEELICDKELRSRLGANARKWVLEKYDIRNNIDKWNSVFKKLYS